jgi:hypothetical protein
VVTILGDNPYTLERFDVYTDPGATGDLGTIVTSDLSNVQNTSIGSFVVVYNATDGNTLHDVAVTRTVNVVDTVPPVITVLGDDPFILERFDVYTDPGATGDLGTIVTPDLSNVQNTSIGSFVVVYNATDGNTAHDVVATRTVEIRDTKPPVITLLGDDPYEIQPGVDFRDVDPLYEVDLGTSVSIDYSNVVTTDNSVFYVVYRASDGVNPDAVVLRRVSVADTLSPIVTIIGDNPYTLERYAEYVDPGATTDTQSGSRFVSTVSTVNNTAVGSYTVTYDATDDINANTIVQRIVNVVDTTAPIVTLNGASSVTLERYGVFSDIDEGVEIEAPGSLVSVDTSQLDNTTQGTYTVTYNVVDDQNNANVITREVVVVDTVPPVVTLNNASTSYTIERYGDWSVVDPGVTVDRGSYLESVTVDNTTIGNQVVSYTVKDGTNTTTATRVITVVDTVAPTGSIANPSYQLERLDIFNDPGVENLDAGTYLAGTDTSNVDNTLPHNSTFDVIYDLGDGTSNTILIRTVTVLDSIPPVISLVNGDVGTTNYTVERGTTYVDPGATTDTGESVTINTSGLNMDVTGTYTVTYSATDSAGNIGTASRTVIVKDTTPPVIILSGGNPYTVERGTTYIDPGVTADTGETVAINTSGLNMAITGTYTVTYSATDSAGNTGTAIRTVIVEDTTAPVIALVGANPYTVERGTTYTDPGATADTGESVTINTSGLIMSVNGTYTVTYSATDSDGNTGTASRTVIVRDTTAPVITLTNGDIGTTDFTVEQDTTYTDPGATTDTGETVIINTSGLNMSIPGTYTVTYSATDSSGNTGTAERTVIVEDTIAPVITLVGANPYTVERGTTYTDPGATADTGETVTVNTSSLNMAVNDTYTVTYSSIDASGNEGTASRTVIVSDGWSEQQKIYASDKQVGDWFGISASISDDGNTAIVGAHWEDDVGAFSTGAAYIFTRTNSSWTEQQKIQASDKQQYDEFGRSVSISGDGNTAIVGAYREDVNTGAAYIFTRTNSSWTEQQKIQASDKQQYDEFGFSVSISEDGDTVIVGAYRESTGGNYAGAAYIFTRTNSSWTEQQKIQASDKQGGDGFGRSVAISGDGNTVIAGAWLEDTGADDAGAAYIFTRTNSSWTEQQKIQASDKQQYDYFGRTVAISEDGDTAIVGAYGEDPDGTSSGGAAYIFTRTNSSWTEQQKIQASDKQQNDEFGISVSISGDGNTAIVGSHWESDYVGATYIFVRTNSSWTERQKIQASDKQQYDEFGFSVAISGDGDTAIVGAYGEDPDGTSNGGSAYIYRYNF